MNQPQNIEQVNGSYPTLYDKYISPKPNAGGMQSGQSGDQNPQGGSPFPAWSHLLQAQPEETQHEQNPWGF